jgi:hypothetical protein
MRHRPWPARPILGGIAGPVTGVALDKLPGKGRRPPQHVPVPRIRRPTRRCAHSRHYWRFGGGGNVYLFENERLNLAFAASIAARLDVEALRTASTMSSTRSRSSGFASEMSRTAFERQLSRRVKNLLTESQIQLNLIERPETVESLICRHTRARTRARAQGALRSADFE